jgi:hypothetical protein
MSNTLNRVRVFPTTTGTGTLTLGAKVSNRYITEVDAGAVSGKAYRYVIEEGNDFEEGVGIWTSGARTLTRATVKVSSIAGVVGTTKMNITTAATVRIIIDAESFDRKIEGDFPGMRNLKVVGTNNGTAITFALQTLAGNTPSPADPGYVFFPDGSSAVVEAAVTLTITSGSTLGFDANIANRIWHPIINNAGTILLGARNCVASGGSIKGFPGGGTLSTTAEGGAGGADSNQVTYASSTVASKPFIIAGYSDFDGTSVIAVAGTWDKDPARFVTFGPTIKRPGEYLDDGTITKKDTYDSGALTTGGGTCIARDASIPQITEGYEFFNHAFVPQSGCNVVETVAHLNMAYSVAAWVTGALFVDAVANALTGSVESEFVGDANTGHQLDLSYAEKAGSTTSRTWRTRVGGNQNGTVSINGDSATLYFANSQISYQQTRERMG